MKKLILSAVLLAAGLVAAFAQEQAAKPSFWDNTYLQAGDGGAISTITGVGNAFEISAGKMFTKCVGIGIGFTNVHIFDENRSYSDNMIGVSFLWSFLGNVNTGIWKPVFCPEIGWMFSGNQNQSSPSLPYIANSLTNYFRVHENVDFVLNLKSYTSVDPQNTGRIKYITIPTLCATVGARYSF